MVAGAIIGGVSGIIRDPISRVESILLHRYGRLQGNSPRAGI